MLRSCWVAVAVLLPLAAFADDQPAPGPPPDDTLSPSFTWGTVAPAKGDAGLSGVYHLLTTQSEYLPLDRRHVTVPVDKFWCFYPDGRCYYGMPTEGLDNFSFEYVEKLVDWQCDVCRWHCSTYHIEGKDGDIAWGDRFRTHSAIHRMEDRLMISPDAVPYTRIDPCNGLRLNGTFKRSDWKEAYGLKQSISFTPDGAFTDEGALKRTQWDFVGAPRPVHDPGLPGRGSYYIASNSLVLVYDDGRKRRISFCRDFREGASQDPIESYVMNGRRWDRVK